MLPPSHHRTEEVNPHLYCLFLTILTHLPLSSACGNWSFVFATIFEPRTCICYRYELPPPTFTYAFLQATISMQTENRCTLCNMLCAEYSHCMQLRWFKLLWVMFPLHLLVACLEVRVFFLFLKCSLVGIFSLWLLHTMEAENTPLLPGLPGFLVLYTMLPKLKCICPHNVCADIFGRLCSPIIPGVVVFGTG